MNSSSSCAPSGHRALQVEQVVDQQVGGVLGAAGGLRLRGELSIQRLVYQGVRVGVLRPRHRADRPALEPAQRPGASACSGFMSGCLTL